MSLPNMNWLGVLCKMLAEVKDCVIVKKSQFGGGGYPREGEVWEGCVKFFWQNLTLAMLMPNMNWLGVLCKELAGVKIE